MASLAATLRTHCVRPRGATRYSPSSCSSRSTGNVYSRPLVRPRTSSTRMCDGPTPIRTSQPIAALNRRSIRVGAAKAESFVIGLLGGVVMRRRMQADPAHAARCRIHDLEHEAVVERDALA